MTGSAAVRARLPIVLLAALLFVIATVQAVVSAGPVAAETPDFYLPPDPLPDARPGEVLRTEPMRLGVPYPGAVTATRIMYRSTGADGEPIAVTGALLRPEGGQSGPHPLIGFAPGTQGVDDHCAQSRTLSEGAYFAPPTDFVPAYEATQIYQLLAAGWTVVVTDYQGLGIPGAHPFLNRLASGHAVLDAVRAARHLESSTAGTGPMGLWGYSQGGGAVAAAAELRAEYAPELEFNGAYAGAPAADVHAVLNQVDRSVFAGLIGYVLQGVSARSPQAAAAVNGLLNDAGRAMMAQTATACLSELVLRVGRSSAAWTVSGRPLPDLIEENSLLRRLAYGEQRMGAVAPAMPIDIAISGGDDSVPFEQAHRLALDWCARGASVRMTRHPIPAVLPGTSVGHVLGMMIPMSEHIEWMARRLAGIPADPGCTIPQP